MIGKKSKFDEHERIQNEIDSDETANSEFKESRASKKKDSDTTHNREAAQESTEFGNISETDNITSSDDDNYEVVQEEIERLTEEAEFYGPDYNESRSRRTLFNKMSKNSSESIDPKISIITSQSIKSDTDLLWDEICNGVKGRNSGIPMGFGRLNKYLGLRKSIYTTIGAAAG
jgi:hypothetical protein